MLLACEDGPGMVVFLLVVMGIPGLVLGFTQVGSLCICGLVMRDFFGRLAICWCCDRLVVSDSMLVM